MKISLRNFAIFSLIFLASSCSFLEKFIPQKSFSALDATDVGTKMDIKNFFSGDIEGFTISQDQNGKITNVSTVKMNGTWDENKGVLKQNFSYNGGRKDSRTWLITIDADGNFDAVGHDVSSAAKGVQISSMAQMTYSLLVPINGIKQEIRYEDRMYLVDDKSMIVISTFKKGMMGDGSGKNIISLRKIVPPKTAN